MLDFIRCCCKKDPVQRHDSALLASHAFIKRDVNELRRIHQQRLSVRHAYGRGGRDMVVGDSSNRPPGLVSLQRFMKRGSQSLVKNKRDANRQPSDDEKFANFDGHGREFRDHVANSQNFLGNNEDRNGIAERSKFFEGKNGSNPRNGVVFSEAMSDETETAPRSGSRHSPMSSRADSQDSHPGNAQAAGPGNERMSKISEVPEWNPNFDARGAFSQGRKDKSASNEAIPINAEGLLSPLDHMYKPSKPNISEPSLVNDRMFLDELDKLSKTFETKLATLRAAHELALQELITSSNLRNYAPLDVTSLMNKAAERSRTEKVCKEVISSSAHYPFMEGVVRNISNPSCMSTGPASPNKSHNSPGDRSSSSSIPDLHGLTSNSSMSSISYK